MIDEAGELRLASMRPQRFSCGIVSNQHNHSDSDPCFNEAAAFQLRNPAEVRGMSKKITLLQ